MTKKEIQDVLEQRDHWLKCFPNWRKGQALFNAIYYVNPEVGNKIRGSDIDPFHRDDKIEKCLEYITKMGTTVTIMGSH